MASSGHDLNEGERNVSRRMSRQDEGDHAVNADDHVRSWLQATSAPLQQQHQQQPSWPLDGTNHVESPQASLSSHTAPTDFVEGGELPPPYRETDPAKDYPSTYEFELDDDNASNAKLYTPFFLRTWVFVAFAFTFAAMLIAVEVMYQFSNRGWGLSTQSPSMHYIWTYGPTLFLSIISCFWGQVEYRVKQLMPWKAMTKGPVPAEDILTLDYVSPWNVSVLVMAAKAKHVAVVLAILGSLLIKLAIIFSAGLLSLKSHRYFEGGTQMHLKDTFLTFSSSFNYSNIQPVVAVIGASQYGLSFPPGTTDVYTTQSFAADHDITDEGSILGANVYVFAADLKCQPGTILSVSAAQCTGRSSTNSCETVGYNVTVTAGTAYSGTCTTNSSQISVSVDDPSDQYYGSVSSANCMERQNDERLTFITGHEYISYSEGAGNAIKSTAVICQPSYTLCKSPVSLFLNGSVSHVQMMNGSCSSIPGVFGSTLSDAILSMVESASDSSLSLFRVNKEGYSGSQVNIDTFFQLMNTTTMPSNLTAFNNVTYLATSARHLFASLSAQVAKANYMTTSEMPLLGIVVAHQQRLYVREVSLRLLESIFAMLIAIALVTLLVRPSSSTPSDVSKIAGMAIVLSRSPRVATILQGLGSGNKAGIKKRLAGRTCHTLIANESSPAFRLTTTCDGDYADEAVSADSVDWWRPMSMSIWSRVGLAFLPLALIAILESVYQSSARHNGLADVDEAGDYIYAWTYLPVFAMVLVQIGYELVHFNTRLFQPFDTLRQSPATAERSIHVNYVSSITPFAMWKACFREHYAVVISGLTMIIAPLLVVVISGLYQPGCIEKYIPAKISLNDTIDNSVAWTNANSSTSNRAQTVSTLIAEANMSYVSWTYDGFVLPRLNSAAFLSTEFGGNSTANTTSVRVRMPGYSASMNCEFTFPNVTTNFNQSGPSYVDIAVPVPEGCGDEDGHNNYWYVGNRSLTEGSADYGIAYIPKNISVSPNCPQVAFVYGQGTINSQASVAAWNLSAAYCSPSVYTAMVNATFTMPGFAIQSVEPDMTTMQIVARGGRGNATLDVETWFPRCDWGADSFFGGLTPGRSGIAWEDLLGEANFTTFSNAVDDLYAIMYSQWLNVYGRTNAPSSAKSLDALVMDPTRTRLMQSAISTRIMEGLLAALALSIVAAYFLLDTRKVLPFNPCSIAATSALLADSDILKNVPEGAEWYSEKELVSKRIFSDYLFSLGWFEGVGGGRKFGIHVGNGEMGDSGG